MQITVTVKITTRRDSTVVVVSSQQHCSTRMFEHAHHGGKAAANLKAEDWSKVKAGEIKAKIKKQIETELSKRSGGTITLFDDPPTITINDGKADKTSAAKNDVRLVLLRYGLTKE